MGVCSYPRTKLLLHPPPPPLRRTSFSLHRRSFTNILSSARMINQSLPFRHYICFSPCPLLSPLWFALSSLSHYVPLRVLFRSRRLIPTSSRTLIPTAVYRLMGFFCLLLSLYLSRFSFRPNASFYIYHQRFRFQFRKANKIRIAT